MSQSTPETIPPAEWFCVRSGPKQEHIAAAHLRQLPGLEVFLPRIRCKRATRRGPAWFIEALFPGYLFARFSWLASLRTVCAASGVQGVVHFGERWPRIEEATIASLRASFGQEELYIVPETLTPDTGKDLLGFFVIGIMGSTWLANFLVAQRPKR